MADSSRSQDPPFEPFHSFPFREDHSQASIATASGLHENAQHNAITRSEATSSKAFKSSKVQKGVLDPCTNKIKMEKSRSNNLNPDDRSCSKSNSLEWNHDPATSSSVFEGLKRDGIYVEKNDALGLDNSKTAARNEPGMSTVPSDEDGDAADTPSNRSSEILVVEMEKLKQELQDAKQKIALQQEELSLARAPFQSSKYIAKEAIPKRAGEANNLPYITNVTANLESTTSNPGHPFSHHTGDISSESLANLGAPNSENLINNPLTMQGFSSPSFITGTATWADSAGRGWETQYSATPASYYTIPQHQHPRAFHGRGDSRPPSPTCENSATYFNDCDRFFQGADSKRSSTHLPRHIPNVAQSGRRDLWGTGLAIHEYHSAGLGSENQQLNASQQNREPQSRPIGTPLSPTASEFTLGMQNGPWPTTTSASSHTYLPPVEPLNYRRLLDRNISCNWKYIVDKIVCSNDQQASIFLQQKLKVGTVEQKYEIVESIVAQAYPLMVNRFGNFLVQRCFEHGTPEQVVAIANSIRGNTLNLSMDAFGCHVVQKAFDAVPEEYKAIMVHELLRRIPETVIHRYACHVWQKLFELRWSDSPPQIMKYVNESLKGMWHEVALGETGSLVVQNIFENCLEEDKRPCVDEVLNSIDIIAHGQFGNWCIQHICEHGGPTDRGAAIDHVLCYATEYSMDQFASKVVEKCLKIGSNDFLERYLERVCEGRADRPRIPLIDIASDQYGNYLIQYILTHANGQHREVVASHIRKHMVSLRGSKFGSRVGMLCSNPAYATRPGSSAPPSSSRVTSGNTPRFSGQYR